MATRTFQYVGRGPVDLESGGTKLTLLPGGLYSFDEGKEKAAITLALSMGVDVIERTPPKVARGVKAAPKVVVDEKPDDRLPKPDKGKGK